MVNVTMENIIGKTEETNGLHWNSDLIRMINYLYCYGLYVHYSSIIPVLYFVHKVLTFSKELLVLVNFVPKIIREAYKRCYSSSTV